MKVELWVEGHFINTMMNLVIPFFAIRSLLTLKGRRIIWWRTVLMWWLMAQVGISMGYHRLFTHRTYDTSPLLTWTLASFGMLAMQGTPMFWGAQHKIHHQNCDTPLDPHSPVQHGFWHAHGGFLNGYDRSTVDQMTDFKQICKQMRDDSEHGLLHRNEMKLAGAIWLGVPVASYAFFGPHATLWYLHVPQVLAWHSTMSVNSAMHTFGYSRPGEEADGCRARNVPWLWGMSMGEAWHANHHGEIAASFEGRWWEIDPVYRAIRFFESLGLIWNVRQRVQEPKDTEFPGAGCLAQMFLPPILVSSLVYMSNRKRPDVLAGLFGDIELADLHSKSN